MALIHARVIRDAPPLDPQVDWSIFPSPAWGVCMSPSARIRREFMAAFPHQYGSPPVISEVLSVKPTPHGLAFAASATFGFAMLGGLNTMDWAVTCLLHLSAPTAAVRNVFTLTAGFGTNFVVEASAAQIRFKGLNGAGALVTSSYFDVPIGRPFLLTVTKSGAGGKLFINDQCVSGLVAGLGAQGSDGGGPVLAPEINVHYFLALAFRPGASHSGYESLVPQFAKNPWRLFRADPRRFHSPASLPISILRRFDGEVWQPATLRRWNGVAWEPANLRRWNGSEWGAV